MLRIPKGFSFLRRWFPTAADKALLQAIQENRRRLETSRRFSRARTAWERAQEKYPAIRFSKTAVGWEINVRESKNTWRTLRSERAVESLPRDLLDAWREYRDAAAEL